jgi:hypothetical protein
VGRLEDRDESAGEQLVSELAPEVRVAVEALLRDIAATVGAANESWLRAQVFHQLRLEVEAGIARTIDELRQRLAEDIQQRIHDEFIDVSWPRCPRHPDHPLWLFDGMWRCTADDVAVAKLGELEDFQR